jgi:hypothetical protein
MTMAKPPDLDLATQIRNDAVHIQQVARAIVDATKQRDTYVRDCDLEAARKLDRRLEDLNSDLRTLEEHRDWLSMEASKARWTTAEKDRAAAIDSTIQPHADVIIAAAERVERAIAELGDAYTALDTAVNALYHNWPAAVPHTPFYRYSLMDVKLRLSGACAYAANGNAFGRLAEFARSYGERTVPLAEGVRRALTNYIRDLRAVPLPAAKPIREIIDV